MSIPRRKGDREPVLTRPHLVLVTARAVPTEVLFRRSPIVPLWSIRVVTRSAGRTMPGQLVETPHPVSEGLHVLVAPPDGWGDLIVGYVSGGERVRVASCWSPVLTVVAARGLLTAGAYSPKLYPIIRFEEDRYVPE